MRKRFSVASGWIRPTMRLVTFGAIVLLGSLPVSGADTSEYLGPHMPYSKFGELPRSTIAVPGATLDLAIVPGGIERHRSAILDWVRESARAIATYLGRFPIARLRILIVPVPGDAIHGTTWGTLGAATRITLGKNASDADIIHSWVLTHEMVHVGFPQLPREQIWLEEGLATYIEPVARAQAGLVSKEYVWRHFLWGMPQGLPKAGDQGLDHTHSWGRTYWGGALFCLLADIEIRRQTENHHSLQDAVSAVVAAGGNTEVDWPLTRVLDIVNQATGVDVLSDLYQRMSATPIDIDLEDLWRRLGVAVKDGKVVFDNTAPLAEIRQAITRAPDAQR